MLIIAATCAGATACIFVVKDDSGGHHPDAFELGSPDSATSSVSADSSRFLEHVKRLASDEFGGRGPGSDGENSTVDYLVEQMKRIGLEPAGPNGSWTQDVPLVGFRGEPFASFFAGDRSVGVERPKDCVLISRHLVPEVDVLNEPIVFVGYGIVAPEFGWDDYKDVDVRGKTILMLVNDPPVSDPKDPSKLDDAVFGGRAMTYYGRWTYKYEIAAAKGAAAALIVHETQAAGYPFEVVRNSWSGENFELDAADKNTGRAKVEGWVTHEKAAELCRLGGADLATLEHAAVSRDFRPVTLACKATFKVKNTLRPVASRNVIGRLPGGDAARASEAIVYSAHWDHFGTDPHQTSGDNIYNGAVDNATGVAGVLEIARVLHDGPRPPRTCLFLFDTGEERGLLGSRWYVEHPLVPLEKTLCDINLDSMNVWGRTADIESIGYGATTLDETIVALAAEQGRVVRGDSEPEKGYAYRSDQFEFEKRGVPALYADGGSLFVGRDPGYGALKRADFIANHYHKPSDEVNPEWDLAGVVQDLNLLVDVGRRVAGAKEWPAWKSGSEFREIRAKMLQPAR